MTWAASGTVLLAVPLFTFLISDPTLPTMTFVELLMSLIVPSFALATAAISLVSVLVARIVFRQR
jgi:hypothetical protein